MTPDTTHLDADRLRVALGPRSYDIVIARGSADGLGRFTRELLDQGRAAGEAPRALLVSDDHLAELGMVDRAQAALERAGVATTRAVLAAGESTKSLAHAALLYEKLAGERADRRWGVVALGGGGIGDLAGFVAATYARGLPLIMAPTTLLAQVDSSVGGKVGVNLPAAKNIIGAFHQPRGVWIDVALLSSLPDRAFRSGIAEVIKYGVILDDAFFAELERDRPAILARSPESLARIVAHSCRLKAGVVERDEREETGLRAVLNFGHTIGHAVESTAGYGAYEHGEAVAVGMAAEARLAERMGWIEPPEVERLWNLIEGFGLPTQAPGLDPDQLLEAMTRDKKNRGGKIHFVLPTAIGRVELTDRPTIADIRAILAAP